MKVAALYIYPVKGMRACPVAHPAVTALGLHGDRRWLVVDSDNKFVSQRENPGLARITPHLAQDGLKLTGDDGSEITICASECGSRVTVTIWHDTVSAALCAPAVNDWLSGQLGARVRLVHMDDDARRKTPAIMGEEKGPMSFADTYPFLITTTGSLAALNREIEKSGGARVGMERFRPNIVIETDDTWKEDYWRRIKIGSCELELVKPCDRCVVTTKDQLSGKSMGKEPLKSLARIRKSAGPRVSGVVFGWHANAAHPGALTIGDAVEVIAHRDEGWPLAGPG